MQEYLVRRLLLLIPEGLKLEYVTTARAKGLGERPTTLLADVMAPYGPTDHG
jgi:ABC-type microcin C transport system permease subunit YejB